MFELPVNPTQEDTRTGSIVLRDLEIMGVAVWISLLRYTVLRKYSKLMAAIFYVSISSTSRSIYPGSAVLLNLKKR
jgi:hypothetical protein